MADDNDPANATAEEAAAINVFNEMIEASGQRIFAAGIAGPDTSMVFDNRRGVGLVSAGSIGVSKEFMAGFWIIEAENFDAANVLAAEASFACNRRIEVRPLLG